jgi:alkyl hydroperoxide reductase subunit AhpF
MKTDGIFVTSKCLISQDWIYKLGCEIEQNIMGEMIKTNALKETSEMGIFACGDVACLGGSVSLAVGDGTMAALQLIDRLYFKFKKPSLYKNREGSFLNLSQFTKCFILIANNLLIPKLLP